ncbi:hypothetical protein IGL98_000489 [Enterococcus sp. DIV0840]|uniref:hypothetical protein n=1 Tax=Enterococcus TaxID=1350 RepID=UPI001A8DEB50|nr:MULTISPECIES: hypothetical protein [Enterococcus]MBO0433532.1 hypothetical protein [Enterococcus sp. DIV0849a]MBO0474619.1 hypothetical protein [Enterococcus ureasiticus]
MIVNGENQDPEVKGLTSAMKKAPNQTKGLVKGLLSTGKSMISKIITYRKNKKNKNVDQLKENKVNSEPTGKSNSQKVNLKDNIAKTTKSQNKSKTIGKKKELKQVIASATKKAEEQNRNLGGQQVKSKDIALGL